MSSQQPQQNKTPEQQIEALTNKCAELLAEKRKFQERAATWQPVEDLGLTPQDVAALHQFKATTEKTNFEMDVRSQMQDVINPPHLLKLLDVQPKRAEDGAIVVEVDGKPVAFREYLDGLKREDAEDKTWWAYFRGSGTRGTGSNPAASGGRVSDPVQQVKDLLNKT